MKNIYSIIILSTLLILGGCQNNKYKVKNVSCESVIIDSVMAKNHDPELAAMINTYKTQLDKEMNQVIGKSEMLMEDGKPQSLLANLTADIMMDAGAKYLNEPVDLALINNGGLRTSLKEGDITVGDIFKIFPFENSMVILYLKGSEINKLFEKLAAQGGEGIAGCRAVYKNRKLENLMIGGKHVDDNKVYKLVTIDYLADGNSGLKMLLNNEKRVDTGILLRTVIINYVENMTLQKKIITSKIDDRAIVL